MSAGPTGDLPPLVPGDLAVRIPIDLLDDASHRRKARAVEERPTLNRPLVVREVDAPVAVYERLLDDLALSADVVRRLDVGTYAIESLGPGVFHIQDGRGASARVERVLSRPGLRAYLADGRMDVPLLPLVTGRGLITLRYEACGERTLTGGQIHFRLDSRVLHAVVRAVVPLVYGAIDAKVQRLTEAALEACRHVAREGAAFR